MSSDAKAQRLILRGGGLAGLGLVIRLGARLLFVFVAARLFGATLFGVYSIAVAVVELAVAVGGLGTKRILFKLLDEAPQDERRAHILLDAALLVLAASTVLALGVMAAVTLLPGAGEADGTPWALILVAPMIAGQALTDLFLAATRWKHRMRYEVVARSIAEPYAAIVATIAAWWLGYGITGLLIGYWAGTLAALACALWGARGSFGGFALRRWRPSRAKAAAILGACAVPTLTDFASGIMARLDIYLVGALLGEAPAGVYGMARQLRTPIRQVRQSFDGLLTPLIARTLAATGAEATGLATASATRLILALQLPLVVAAVVIGLPLLHWLGPEFAAGYWALVLLGLAETIQGAFGVSDLILLYRRSSAALAVTAASSAVNLAAGWLLIPRMGVDGAALAVLLAMIAGALVRRFALRRFLAVRVPLVHGAAPIAAALLATLAAAPIVRSLAPGQSLIAYAPALAVALAVYGAVLWSWLAWTRESLKLVDFRTE